MKKSALSVFAALAMAACGGEYVDDGSRTAQEAPIDAVVQTHAIRGITKPAQQPASNAGPSSNGISYRGGAVMTGTPNIYLIWYGNWSGNAATTIIQDLATNIGGSAYYNINSTYYNSAGTHVSNAAHFAKAVTDNYSQGTSFADAAVATIVKNQITSGALPIDDNAVYFVLTSKDVKETSGFCTQWCGWHTHSSTMISGHDIKYSIVGNPEQCPSACTMGYTPPNGNVGGDGMASIFSHEFEEATSDPDLNAWYDNRGYENADKCAWTFGTTYTTSNGGVANMKIGTRDYLIQRNWVNAAGGYCDVKY